MAVIIDHRPQPPQASPGAYCNDSPGRITPKLAKEEIEAGALVPFGIWLREQRGPSRTLEQTARLLEVGKSTVHRWEQGKAEPSSTELQGLAQIMRRDVNELLDKIASGRDGANGKALDIF